MILREPGRIKADHVYTNPIGTVDITPTVMGLLGLPSNDHDQGRNLAEELTDVEAARTDSSSDIAFLRNAGEKPSWLAAVDERYKLILSVNDVPWLFDAVEDPDELKNFYKEPRTNAVSRRLAKALQRYAEVNDDPHIRADGIASSLRSILQN